MLAPVSGERKPTKKNNKTVTRSETVASPEKPAFPPGEPKPRRAASRGSGHRRRGSGAQVPGVRASERGRTAALPVEQRAVDVQVLHGHLNAPVGVAGGRHGAGRSAAQVSQVGELVVRDGGQGAADGLRAHGGGPRRPSGRRPLPEVPAAAAAPPGAGPHTRSRGRSSPRRPAPRSLSRARANSLWRQVNAKATRRSGDGLPLTDPALQGVAVAATRRSELRLLIRSSDVSGRTPSQGLSRASARGRRRRELRSRVPGWRSAGDGLRVGKEPGALSASSHRALYQPGFGRVSCEEISPQPPHTWSSGPPAWKTLLWSRLLAT